jgi:hypothetical protein
MAGKVACVGCALTPEASKQLGRTGCLVLIDLADPGKPRLRGQVPFPDPWGPNGLTVVGKVAFAAGGQTVQAIDISDPDKPKVLVTAHLPKVFTGGLDDAHDLVYQDGYLYVTAQTTHALVVLRVENLPQLK